ncbi:MAG: MBL fold metallo-hydrolase [Clostridia bacterium]|jgi:ribonuclease BN (tRNA processing enzyme)|nr:MBL fold metallo-hydrolase [Clostridia bacterium]MDH7573044.1 MBL fold metallo-hydrolase [Clostridia bacterium]
MELRVLGRWAPFAPPGGACPGYLIGDGSEFVLVDCGHGVISRLLGSVGLDRLRAVLLSHLHPDHWFDLPALRHALRARAGRGHGQALPAPPLPLYAPAQPADFFALIASYREAFIARAVPELAPPGGPEPGPPAPLVEVEVGPVRARFFAARHAVPACCLDLVCAGRRLFYTGDTAWWEGLAEMARGADVVLAEASLLTADRPLLPDDHLTAAQAAELAGRAGARTLILTHFWPDYDPESLRAEAECRFSGQVLLAEEGRVYGF